MPIDRGVLVAVRVLTVGTCAMAQVQELPGDPFRGAAIDEKHCIRCHGPHGEGNGPDAARLTVRPANFQSPESRSKTDSELRAAMVWGFSFSPMHGWWDRLTREEIRDVISSIRRIAPYRPKSP